MNVRFHQKFVKSYQKRPPKIQQATDKRLRLFAENPFSPILENHQLTGKFTGYRSINITGDFRAIYKEISNAEVIFVLLGTHSKLYG